MRPSNGCGCKIGGRIEKRGLKKKRPVNQPSQSICFIRKFVVTNGSICSGFALNRRNLWLNRLNGQPPSVVSAGLVLSGVALSATL